MANDMTCKDCIHYGVCTVVEMQTNKEEDYLTEFGCESFLPAAEDEKIKECKRLEAECERLVTLLDAKCERCIARDRAEAVKEFAERLKNGIHEDIQSGCDCADYLTDDLPDIIDNLVKEMTEENNGYNQ